MVSKKPYLFTIVGKRIATRLPENSVDFNVSITAKGTKIT